MLTMRHAGVVADNHAAFSSRYLRRIPAETSGKFGELYVGLDGVVGGFPEDELVAELGSIAVEGDGGVLGQGRCAFAEELAILVGCYDVEDYRRCRVHHNLAGEADCAAFGLMSLGCMGRIEH